MNCQKILVQEKGTSQSLFQINFLQNTTLNYRRQASVQGQLFMRWFSVRLYPWAVEDYFRHLFSVSPWRYRRQASVRLSPSRVSFQCLRSDSQSGFIPERRRVISFQRVTLVLQKTSFSPRMVFPVYEVILSQVVSLNSGGLFQFWYHLELQKTSFSSRSVFSI